MARTQTKGKNSKESAGKLRGQVTDHILDWYASHARDLPWRYKTKEQPDPYRVWLSEIMLQQTTVPAVKAYFMKFTALWPDIHALAAAQREDIMSAWAGLGYYSRARNLHKCAQVIVKEYNAAFPQDEKALKALPGIGDYTAAAMRAIAFHKSAVVVDGNIERITARYFAIEEKLPASKPALRTKAAAFYEGAGERCGDIAQTLMDIGSDICTAKNPLCSLCPLSTECAAHIKGLANELPRREKKKPKPARQGKIYWIEDKSGRVLLHNREDTRMLGGMSGLPTTLWDDRRKERRGELPDGLELIEGEELSARVYHTFTHFDLELKLIRAGLSGQPPQDYHWAEARVFNAATLPTVFRKAFQLFLSSYQS